MPIIIEAAYKGSTAVRIDGRLHSFTRHQARGGVLPRAARRLISEGADPDTLVRVTRDGTPVFALTTLGQWAAITYEEGDSCPRGLRRRVYRPHSSERAQLDGGGEAAREAAEAPSLVLTHP